MSADMELDSATKYGESRAPAPSTHYTQHELKQIGNMCSNRLPPASAVQAMFLYEMQRQSEVESLFQGQMFRLATSERTNDDHEAHIWELEEQLKNVQQKLHVKDVEERLATSDLRMTTQQNKLNQCATELTTYAKRMAEVTSKVDELVKAKETGDQPTTTISELKEEIALSYKDIDSLFDERDALMTMLQLSDSRIAKLEDLVRALTLQHSSNPSSRNASPAMTQRLAVQTTNGQEVDLLVPRGNGLPAAKENRAPVKSFTPGHQWA